MDIAILRQIMGLSRAAAAEEMGISADMLRKFEESSLPPTMNRVFLSAFPIQPDYLRTEKGDPFLPSFDQSTPADRIRRWREEHGMSIEQMAQTIRMDPARLAAFEADDGGQVARQVALKIEERAGIPHRWLMYGDGRALLSRTEPESSREEQASLQAENTEDSPEGRRPGEKPLETDPSLAHAGKLVRGARSDAGHAADLFLAEAGSVLGATVSDAAGLSGDVSGTEAAKPEKQTVPPARAQKDTTEKQEVDLAVSPSERVHMARKEAGMTLAQVGALLGVTPQRISMMEHGKVSEEQADIVIQMLHKA